MLLPGEPLPTWPEVKIERYKGSEIPIIPTVIQTDRVWGEKIERRWSAYGPAGEIKSRTQIIIVLDKLDFFKIPDDLTIECGEGLPAPDYSVLDHCGDFDLSISEKVIPSIPVYLH